MCMQDLIISRSVTTVVRTDWTVVDIDGVPHMAIPPNANRLSLWVYGAGSGGAMSLKIALTGAAPIPIPAIYSPGGSAIYMHVRDYPGYFGRPLYVQDTESGNFYVETVMDPPLADAVQRGYGRLLTGGD